MHVLTTHFRHELDSRRWLSGDLVTRSGLSIQVVSRLLNDTRDELIQRPDDATVDGLAMAFGVDRKAILSKVSESMGLPSGELVVVPTTDGVTDEELISELGRRLARTSPDGASGRFGPPRAVPDHADYEFDQAVQDVPAATYEPYNSLEDMEREQVETEGCP